MFVCFRVFNFIKENKPLLGGWVKRNPDSAEVQEAAQHAVKMFNEKSKGKKMFKLIEVTDAQSQVRISFHKQNESAFYYCNPTTA